MFEVYILKSEFILIIYFDKSLFIGYLLKWFFIIDKC